MASGRGIVKAVTSGDTIVLYGGKTASGPPAERELTLSWLQAPRIGRTPDRKDEPFAWHSREFLRKKIVGKTVSFKIDYNNPALKREFATIRLDEEIINHTVVREGWCRVRTLGPKDAASAEHAELSALEQTAQSAGKGVWVKDVPEDAVRNVVFPTGEAAEELFKRLKGKGVAGVVEHANSGSLLRVTLLPVIDANFYVVGIHLTGIQAPSIKVVKDETTGQPKVDQFGKPVVEAQPFAYEARYFTECRLVNRDVKVTLEFLDTYKNLFGTVLVPQGNISEELLKTGLAKIAEWSIAHAMGNDRLRAAERQAKTQKLRLFKDYVPPAAIVGDKEYEGVVSEVLSGDQLVVYVPDINTERRVNLASIRAPFMGRREKKEEGKPTESTGEPWSWDAKEYLRNKAIGHKVKVLVDYTKESKDTTPVQTRTFATVLLEPQGQNLGEMVVRAGLADVMRHRADDDARSRAYDALVAAEMAAKQAHSGKHGKHEPPKHHFNDLTQFGKGLAPKARQMLPFLQKGLQKCVVEHVINGGRMVLFVPKENCLILFNLLGLRCPRAGSRTEPAEPYGNEALMQTRLALLNRNVDVDVDSCDKTGTFIGRVYHNKKEYGPQLLQQGLARLFTVPGKPMTELAALEMEAKRARLKIWEKWDPSQEAAAEAAPATVSQVQQQLINVVVSELVDGSRMYVRLVEEDEDVEQLEEALSALSLSPPPPGWHPEVGKLVVAQYSVDEKWYRARVESKSGGKFEVLFVDYGNREQLTADKMRPASAAVSAFPVQALKCQLAYIKVPGLTEEYGKEAADAVSEWTLNRQLVANVDYRQGDTMYITLWDPEAETVINEALLRVGLARVENRKEPALRELIAKLREHEAVGRATRNYLWELGDIGDDDDAPEFGYKPPVKKGAAQAPAQAPKKK